MAAKRAVCGRRGVVFHLLHNEAKEIPQISCKIGHKTTQNRGKERENGRPMEGEILS